MSILGINRIIEAHQNSKEEDSEMNSLILMQKESLEKVDYVINKINKMANRKL
jgi:hypothetical protein